MTMTTTTAAEATTSTTKPLSKREQAKADKRAEAARWEARQEQYFEQHCTGIAAWSDNGYGGNDIDQALARLVYALAHNPIDPSQKQMWHDILYILNDRYIPHGFMVNDEDDLVHIETGKVIS